MLVADNKFMQMNKRIIPFLCLLLIDLICDYGKKCVSSTARHGYILDEACLRQLQYCMRHNKNVAKEKKTNKLVHNILPKHTFTVSVNNIKDDFRYF